MEQPHIRDVDRPGFRQAASYFVLKKRPFVEEACLNDDKHEILHVSHPRHVSLTKGRLLNTKVIAGYRLDMAIS